MQKNLSKKISYKIIKHVIYFVANFFRYSRSPDNILLEVGLQRPSWYAIKCSLTHQLVAMWRHSSLCLFARLLLLAHNYYLRTLSITTRFICRRAPLQSLRELNAQAFHSHAKVSMPPRRLYLFTVYYNVYRAVFFYLRYSSL